MEPTADHVTSKERKKKCRKRGKKREIVTSSENGTNPFLKAIERPLMLINHPINLQRPKKVLEDFSILGLDNDLNIKSIQSIVEYKTLDKYSQKFKEIQSFFPPTLNILKIQQVFNPFLRLSFQLKRYFSYYNIKPLKLFHGTKLKYVHSICTYNFNWRFNGAEKGHKCGQGVNFTPKPKFAMNFCEKNVGVKVLLLADVLVINKEVGNENLQVPSKNCDTTIRKDGCTLVKFCDAEFYPSYVIFFQKI